MQMQMQRRRERQQSPTNPGRAATTASSSKPFSKPVLVTYARRQAWLPVMERDSAARGQPDCVVVHRGG